MRLRSLDSYMKYREEQHHLVLFGRLLDDNQGLVVLFDGVLQEDEEAGVYLPLNVGLIILKEL